MSTFLLEWIGCGSLVLEASRFRSSTSLLIVMYLELYTSLVYILKASNNHDFFKVIFCKMGLLLALSLDQGLRG